MLDDQNVEGQVYSFPQFRFTTRVRGLCTILIHLSFLSDFRGKLWEG